VRVQPASGGFSKAVPGPRDGAGPRASGARAQDARTSRAEAKAPFPNEWGGARAQASSATTAERQLRSIH